MGRLEWVWENFFASRVDVNRKIDRLLFGGLEIMVVS